MFYMRDSFFDNRQLLLLNHPKDIILNAFGTYFLQAKSGFLRQSEQKLVFCSLGSVVEGAAAGGPVWPREAPFLSKDASLLIKARRNTQ